VPTASDILLFLSSAGAFLQAIKRKGGRGGRVDR